MTVDSPVPLPVPADIAGALGRLADRFPGGVPPVVHYFASLPSTNDHADRLADRGVPAGTAVVAEQQTAGRGRLGRAWFSPPGAGLYVSVIVRFPPTNRPTNGLPAGTASLIPLAAGVGFADGLRTCTHLPIDIKWPNDLVVDRRKLAGILTEASGSGDLRAAVVGVGINLRTAAYPTEIADRATSIETELGRPVERAAVLAECLAAFAGRIAELRSGNGAAILDRWRVLAPSSVGSRVEWASAAGTCSGVTQGIDDDGALLVATISGVERVVAGDVRWT
jgi:BirA family biotin operon repressor/biotin-[acetyl-CoA-carboxylase] ligase